LPPLALGCFACARGEGPDLGTHEASPGGGPGEFGRRGSGNASSRPPIDVFRLRVICFRRSWRSCPGVGWHMPVAAAWRGTSGSSGCVRRREGAAVARRYGQWRPVAAVGQATYRVRVLAGGVFSRACNICKGKTSCWEEFDGTHLHTFGK